MAYRSRADRFFTDGEKERVATATRNAEKTTAGEIAIVVVDGSSHYPEAEVLSGLFIGGLAGLIISVLFFHASVWAFIPAAFLLFFPAKALTRHLDPLKMAFVGAGRKHRAVREAALRTFYDKGLYRTRENTGVLFFLSLLERKVWVIADKGIHRKISQERLNRFAAMVSKGVAEGRACDALCEAIAEIGALLARHFPVGPGDVNELPDQLICEPDGPCDPD